jgi:hypothetical protein
VLYHVNIKVSDLIFCRACGIKESMFPQWSSFLTFYNFGRYRVQILAEAFPFITVQQFYLFTQTKTQNDKKWCTLWDIHKMSKNAQT